MWFCKESGCFFLLEAWQYLRVQDPGSTPSYSPYGPPGLLPGMVAGQIMFIPLLPGVDDWVVGIWLPCLIAFIVFKMRSGFMPSTNIYTVVDFPGAERVCNQEAKKKKKKKKQTLITGIFCDMSTLCRERVMTLSLRNSQFVWMTLPQQMKT